MPVHPRFPLASDLPTESDDDLAVQDPSFKAPADDAALGGPAPHEKDWHRIQDFHEALNSQTMEFCQRCKERWFDLRISGDICARCHRRDRQRKPDEPCLFSEANNTDPGPLPSSLPLLIQMEETLTARVHVFIEIRRVRGQQFCDQTPGGADASSTPPLAWLGTAKISPSNNQLDELITTVQN